MNHLTIYLLKNGDLEMIKTATLQVPLLQGTGSPEEDT